MMKRRQSTKRPALVNRGLIFFVLAVALVPVLCAAGPRRKRSRPHKHHHSASLAVADHHPMFGGHMGGTWYWMRSPEEEKQAASSLFNRYCIRCHGVDGRGVWDIPGIPNFTNVHWQASRSEDQLARAIMQGRGAVMPPFRGALGLEEAWALARYVRGLVPGTEASRRDDEDPEKGKETGEKAGTKPDAAGSEPAADDAASPKAKQATEKPDAADPGPAAEEVPSPRGKKAAKKPEPAADDAPSPKGNKAKKKADNVPTLKPPK